MLKPLIFPCHRENRSGDSQEYYEFTIYFLDRNLPNMKSQKPHMVKKEKKRFPHVVIYLYDGNNVFSYTMLGPFVLNHKLKSISLSHFLVRLLAWSIHLIR